jgi:REP element-mobilizing transposase RayT
MAYVKNWLHCVWGTKSRTPFLTAEKKLQIINHIKTNAKSKTIYIDCINGHLDHVHCLISLNPDQSLSKVIQLIKGESSFWINKNGIINSKFEWADEYFGISVGESELHRVREYIRNQEEHHRLRTWEEEYNEFIMDYKLIKSQG